MAECPHAEELIMTHTHAARLFVLWAFLGSPVLMAGCANTMIAAKEAMGIPKRDQMVARVEDARDSQTAAKEEFASALDEFLAVTKADGGELEKAYRRLSDRHEASKKAAARVTSRISDVERVATALFREWEKELTQYTSESLRAKSREQLDQTRTQYDRLLASMKAAEAKMPPVLAVLGDHVLFLKHNLNARAIGSLSGAAGEVSAEVDRLIRDMNAAIDEANAFIGQMNSAGT